MSPTTATQTATIQGGGQPIAHANQPPAARVASKPAGFGLPCAKCKTYYAANLKVCPVCKGTERVAPAVATIPAATPLSEETPDLAVLEAERERFLREFKAQLSTSSMQVRPTCALRAARGTRTIRGHRNPQPFAKVATNACRNGLTCWKPPFIWTSKRPPRLFTTRFGPTPQTPARPTKMPRRPCSASYASAPGLLKPTD